MTDYKDAVDRGVALLDEEVPDWRSRVYPGMLSMCCPYGCILGQVFGHYLTGLDALDIPWEPEAVLAHGFEYDYAAKDSAADRAELEAEWLTRLPDDAPEYPDDDTR